MTTLTPEDRARLRDLAHRMLETPVRGAASTALAEGVTALLDALDAETSRADRAEAAVQRVREMHEPERPGTRRDRDGHEIATCALCVDANGWPLTWPCDTIRTLDGDA